MILRIDNLFFNATDIEGLARFYSDLLGTPIRRAQEEAPGLMWAELSVGGMELSFRRAAATAEIHSRAKDEFREVAPGDGATISFEVDDTDKERDRLMRAGAKLHGEPLECTSGQEIISVLSDPFGRVFQLYEPRFDDRALAALAARGAGAALMSSRPIRIGSNVRSIGDVGYSVVSSERDVKAATEFYAALIGDAPNFADAHSSAFELDGAVIQFRSVELHNELRSNLATDYAGVAPVIETRNLGRALDRGIIAQSMLLNGEHHEPLLAGRRAAIEDPEGNMVELWERNGSPVLT